MRCGSVAQHWSHLPELSHAHSAQSEHRRYLVVRSQSQGRLSINPQPDAVSSPSTAARGLRNHHVVAPATRPSGQPETPNPEETSRAPRYYSPRQRPSLWCSRLTSVSTFLLGKMPMSHRRARTNYGSVPSSPAHTSGVGSTPASPIIHRSIASARYLSPSVASAAAA
jgi:hypothetical protein